MKSDRLPTWDQSYRIEICLEVDSGGNGFWVARHPELRGCLAQGDTPAEALASLGEARALYLEGLEAAAVPRPQINDYRPKAAVLEPSRLREPSIL
jgi:predicted RNase H-like HicB family nuclease